MELNPNISPDIDSQIALYLTGEATPEQRTEIEQWRLAHPANEKYFSDMLLIYKNAGWGGGADDAFDTDAAWQTFGTKLRPVGGSTNVSPSGHYALWLRMAASIVVVITVGVLGYRYIDSLKEDTRTLATAGTMASDTLPDGSEVFLNRHSTIHYDGNSGKHTHTVALEGEAYFRIHHDDEKIFVVTAGEIFIRDIGTAFNVNAYPDSATTEVVVEEGAVVMYTAVGDSIYVTAGQRGVFDKMTQAFSLDEPRSNTTSYKTKNFSFTNESLAAVVETLNMVYTEQLHIDESVRECKLTVSFRNEDPMEIADIIAETLGLTVTRNGNNINLTGPGCEAISL